MLINSFVCNPKFQEFNLVANALFKKEKDSAVRFFVEGGYIICFHWSSKVPLMCLPTKVEKWAADPACIGIICCDPHSLPKHLYKKSLAYSYDPNFKGSLYKLFNGETIEVHIKESK